MFWLRSSLLAVAFLALAACGEIPRPFEDEYKAIAPSALLVPRADAAMVVVPVRGAPPEASVELAELVADRLRVLEVPASTRVANPQSRILEGEVSTTTLPGGLLAVDILWRVVEPNGLPRATARQIEQVPEALWRRGDRTVLLKLATDIAGRIDREIRIDSGVLPAVATLRIRTPLVEGAPGDGNESLARAMRLLLARQQVAVVEAADREALSLLGRVSVVPAPSGEDRVEIQWIVQSAEGKALGTVRQSNTVAQGSLGGRWGPVAYAAAEGGVDGVMQVLERQAARPAAAGRAGR